MEGEGGRGIWGSILNPDSRVSGLCGRSRCGAQAFRPVPGLRRDRITIGAQKTCQDFGRQKAPGVAKGPSGPVPHGCLGQK